MDGIKISSLNECSIIVYINLLLQVAYKCILYVSYYAGIMLNAFSDPLCSKLCWHNWRVSNCNSIKLLAKFS